jgi:SAM-dependent methyltransferase
MSELNFSSSVAELYIRQGKLYPTVKPTDEVTRDHEAMAHAQANRVVDTHGPNILNLLDVEPQTVLDIGCGLGLFALSMDRCIHNGKFYLVDGSKELYQEAFREDGSNLVTDMDITREFLIANNLPQNRFIILPPSAEVVAKLPPMDLIVSHDSWFYHYPPEIYWDAVRQVMHEDSYLNVSIRLNPVHGHPEYYHWLTERFDSVQVISVTGEGQRRRLTVMCHGPTAQLS